MIKQIYASLEIAEREVRLLVGEYFNTRFNIIKISRTPCDGVKDFRIVDEQLVKNAILTCLKETEEKLGTKIEKTVLLIPPINFKRMPLKVNVVPESTGVKKADVVRAITHTLEFDVGNDVTIINRIPTKYTINGISSFRLPEKEVCDEVIVDIDLLCADSEITYSYVKVVEECGIEIMDICLSSYAICKESVLIEQSLNKNVILLDINNLSTVMSLVSKGKLTSSEVVNMGLEEFAKSLYQEYPLPYPNLLRLIKYNGSIDNLSNDVIFAYSKNDKTYNITHAELNEIIKFSVDKYIDNIYNMCKTILETSECLFVVVGEGGDMKLLIDKLKEKTGCEVKAYHPDTLGVRDAGLNALLGSFYCMKEVANIRDLKVACVDLLEFDKVVDHKKIDVEGETLTTKIKTLFKEIVTKKEN